MVRLSVKISKISIISLSSASLDGFSVFWSFVSKSCEKKSKHLRPKLAGGCNNRSLRHSPLVRARANGRLGPTVSYGEQGANTGGHLRRQTETQARTQTLGGDSLPEQQETKDLSVIVEQIPNDIRSWRSGDVRCGMMDKRAP